MPASNSERAAVGSMAEDMVKGDRRVEILGDRRDRKVLLVEILSSRNHLSSESIYPRLSSRWTLPV